VAIAVVFGVLWWQGQVTRLADYCRETWVELQKCTWPTVDELKGSTALIAIMVAMMGLYIYFVDYVCDKTFRFPIVQALLLVGGLAAFAAYKKASSRQ